ncbi:unnamed protein product [Peronospora belbahrii]|uniref:Uncharacterized protein n=1 Tax=Peronospora belbahrii TaxID=622444 RepID=A0AAU9L3R9_9STRA|nr:unnamed protein product [Peronospora belbahrii]CAH0520349.1 unnamed protein product [Peronospora belbahrii]
MTGLLQSDTESLVSPASRIKQSRYFTFSTKDDNAIHTEKWLHDSKCSLDTASFWSRLLYSFANPMMSAGNERQLNFDDLWELEGENCSAIAFHDFEKHYERHN